MEEVNKDDINQRNGKGRRGEGGRRRCRDLGLDGQGESEQIREEVKGDYMKAKLQRYLVRYW